MYILMIYNISIPYLLFMYYNLKHMLDSLLEYVSCCVSVTSFQDKELVLDFLKMIQWISAFILVQMAYFEVNLYCFLHFVSLWQVLISYYYYRFRWFWLCYLLMEQTYLPSLILWFSQCNRPFRLSAQLGNCHHPYPFLLWQLHSI